MATTIIFLWPNTGLSKHGLCVSALLGLFWNHRFCGPTPKENVVCGFVQGCRTGQCGCQSVGVAVIPCALVFWGVRWAVALYCDVLRGRVGLCLPHVFRGTCRAVTQPCPSTVTPCSRTFAPRTRTWPVLGRGGGRLPATRYPQPTRNARCARATHGVGERMWWTAGTTRGGSGHLGLTHTETQRGSSWTA